MQVPEGTIARMPCLPGLEAVQRRGTEPLLPAASACCAMESWAVRTVRTACTGHCMTEKGAIMVQPCSTSEPLLCLQCRVLG